MSKLARSVRISMQVWNPSFDVTPSDLITGIITEEGIVPKATSGGFGVPAVAKREKKPQANGTHKSGEKDSGSNIPGFYALDLDTVKDYLASKPELCKLLGSPDSKSQWKVSVSFLSPFFASIIVSPENSSCSVSSS